jgi:transposase
MLVYIGIDWSQQKHDLCFLNQAGTRLAERTIPHTQTGFAQLEAVREKLGLEVSDCVVGLETAHNILLDHLWDQGYARVYVLPPNLVKSSRGRFRQSRARTDLSDAWLIADILRTDHARLQIWEPDSLLTQQIRSRVNYVQLMTKEIVRLTNYQRSILLRYYPAAADLFSGLKTLISQHFISTFPTPETTNGLDLETFRTFARQHAYTRPEKLPATLAKLHQAHPIASGEVIESYQSQAQSLASLLLPMIRTKANALRELSNLFLQHPDHFIYASLPGAGDFLQPALLAKFGDHRYRFPTASRVQAVAGTCPVTISSGKHKSVRFRYACDHQFRQIVQQWAKASLASSIWAHAYYARVRPHCDSDNHAYRCLANRWLSVLWRLWHDRKPYDEIYHLQQRTARSQPREAVIA